MAELYNFPKHYKGDFWDGLASLVVTRDSQAVDLSGASVCMQIRQRPSAPPAFTISTDNGRVELVSPL